MVWPQQFKHVVLQSTRSLHPRRSFCVFVRIQFNIKVSYNLVTRVQKFLQIRVYLFQSVADLADVCDAGPTTTASSIATIDIATTQTRAAFSTITPTSTSPSKSTAARGRSLGMGALYIWPV